eukprot:3179760-Pyramimonas_sp.AAC.1
MAAGEGQPGVTADSGLILGAGAASDMAATIWCHKYQARLACPKPKKMTNYSATGSGMQARRYIQQSTPIPIEC